MEICDVCGRSNKRTKYFQEYDAILCDSCLLMFKKHPVIYIPPKGELHYDEGNILCHTCGRSFKKLAEHIKNKHKMTTEEYREKFGLNRRSKLTGKNFIPPKVTVDIVEMSKGSRFEKGHKKSQKPKRLQTIKNRTGIKYNKNLKSLDSIENDNGGKLRG